MTADRHDDNPLIARSDSDLEVGRTYRGESASLGDEPIQRLLRCGNMGGFRILGSITARTLELVSLYTTFGDSLWPDQYDASSGRFTYYGDNKKPGRDLHDTPQHGNALLREIYAALHVWPNRRKTVPPAFVFTSSPVRSGRAVRFLGVAAPGAANLDETEDLVALWRSVGEERFQNYRAAFTLLDIPVVPRAWIEALHAGEAIGPHTPAAWRSWVEEGTYRALQGG